MIALDIHEFYNDLKNAGFNEQQAEVIAIIQNKTATAAIEQTKNGQPQSDDVSTKRDLQELEFKLTSQWQKLLIKVLGTIVVILIGLIKIFH